MQKPRLPDPLHSATARMAKLVDAWDLKSPARKGVPVRFRVRAPSISRACRRFACRPWLFSIRKCQDRSATHLAGVIFFLSVFGCSSRSSHQWCAQVEPVTVSPINAEAMTQGQSPHFYRGLDPRGQCIFGGIFAAHFSQYFAGSPSLVAATSSRSPTW